jgi:hypothetical protein
MLNDGKILQEVAMKRYSASIMDINGAVIGGLDCDDFRTIYNACRITIRSGTDGAVCALIADNTREAGRKTCAAFYASETLYGVRVVSFARITWNFAACFYGAFISVQDRYKIECKLGVL